MNMSNQKYVRLNKTLIGSGILVKPEEVNLNIENPNIDHYTSAYYYTTEHFDQFKATGTISGIEDVKTDKIWFDFDSKDNLGAAKEDAIVLIERLKEYTAPEKLEIYFSGKKGFNVVLNLTKEITPKQVKSIAKKFAGDLKTFDTSIYNASRLLRVPGTKHQDTEFYKTALTLDELKNLKRAELLEKASKPLTLKEASPIKHLIDLDENLFESPEVNKEVKETVLEELDLFSKPPQWKSSKWALMQGFFGPGERDQALIILAATCRSMGYDKLTTYYMCKSALKKSWERHGKGDFSKEELFNNIIEQIYNERWNAKHEAYKETNDLFLQKKADELGIKELTNKSTVNIKGALKIFKDYAVNIDHLTLKTGIKELDEKQRITVGMAFGIVASPGSGKTTLALTMLHSMSKAGELCVFFSYDMYAPLIVQKIIQKHWEGDDIDQVFEKYKSNDEEYVQKVEDLISTEYPNVEFCFETGQTIEDIRQTIRDAEQTKGKRCKFVVMDYNELVITDVSDPTQSANKVAQSIRAMAQTDQLCVLSLFQPTKMTGDPSQEIMSYRAAKGGSGIEQSLRLMLGVSRPGYDPNNPSVDKFLNLKVLKNNMGQIFSVDLHWNGYKGEIRTLKHNEKSELAALRKALEDKKNGSKEDWNF